MRTCIMHTQQKVGSKPYTHDAKACLGNSLCSAYARCWHPCWFENHVCEADSNCKARD